MILILWCVLCYSDIKYCDTPHHHLLMCSIIPDQCEAVWLLIWFLILYRNCSFQHLITSLACFVLTHIPPWTGSVITTIETLPIYWHGGSLFYMRSIPSDSLPGGDGEEDKRRRMFNCLTHLRDCAIEWLKQWLEECFSTDSHNPPLINWVTIIVADNKLLLVLLPLLSVWLMPVQTNRVMIEWFPR